MKKLYKQFLLKDYIEQNVVLYAPKVEHCP